MAQIEIKKSISGFTKFKIIYFYILIFTFVLLAVINPLFRYRLFYTFDFDLLDFNLLNLIVNFGLISIPIPYAYYLIKYKARNIPNKKFFYLSFLVTIPIYILLFFVFFTSEMIKKSTLYTTIFSISIVLILMALRHFIDEKIGVEEESEVEHEMFYHINKRPVMFAIFFIALEPILVELMFRIFLNYEFTLLFGKISIAPILGAILTSVTYALSKTMNKKELINSWYYFVISIYLIATMYLTSSITVIFLVHMCFNVFIYTLHRDLFNN